MSYIKNFVDWVQHKITLNSKDFGRNFRKQEIWWASVGVNIGSEIDGKGVYYTRPVLILRKFNSTQFWGIPMTTQGQESEFLIPISAGGKDGFLNMSQLRCFDSKRLQRKIEKISDKEYARIIDRVKRLLG